MGAEECVRMRRRQQLVPESDQVRQIPAPRPPSGKMQELCLERGTSPLRNPEVVWGESPTPKSSKFLR